MPHRPPLALVLAAAVLSGGCGTLDNVTRPTVAPADSPGAPVCRAYGGVRGDWAVMSEYPWDRTTSYIDYAVLPLLAAGTLLFDVVGDTVTLPYTAVEEVRRAFYRPAAPSGFAPVVVPEAVTAAPPATTPQHAVGSQAGR